MKKIRHEIAAEFKHTWPRHRGSVRQAASIFDMTPEALVRALYRAKRDGIDVRFIDDSKRNHIEVHA